jgi:hypothetical protein
MRNLGPRARPTYPAGLRDQRGAHRARLVSAPEDKVGQIAISVDRRENVHLGVSERSPPQRVLTTPRVIRAVSSLGDDSTPDVCKHCPYGQPARCQRGVSELQAPARG